MDMEDWLTSRSDAGHNPDLVHELIRIIGSNYVHSVNSCFVRSVSLTFTERPCGCYYFYRKQQQQQRYYNTTSDIFLRYRTSDPAQGARVFLVTNNTVVVVFPSLYILLYTLPPRWCGTTVA